MQKRIENPHYDILENVGDELVSPVVPARRRIVVLPRFVVDRNSHLRLVPVVKTVGTSVVLVAPVVLWVRHVRIVVEAIVVLGSLAVPPSLSESFTLTLGLSRLWLANGNNHERWQNHASK